MRKILFTLAVVLGTAVFCNAQLFVGGALGLEVSSEKVKYNGGGDDKEKEFAFLIAPKVGYFMSEKFAVGLEFGIGLNHIKNANDVKNNATVWAIQPFARHYMAQLGKFSIMTEATIGIGGTKQKTKANSTTVDGLKTFTFGINIVPVLTYSLTEKIDLEASLNFLNLGFNVTSYKDDPNYPTIDKRTESGFDFGVNYDNILNVGALTIGAIFKF